MVFKVSFASAIPLGAGSHNCGYAFCGVFSSLRLPVLADMFATVIGLWRMQRIRFFDIAKGIAILAVILGHSAIEANLCIPHRAAQIAISFCFSFHMPLFFILAGYFMHPERAFRWAKESRQLLCTYAVTTLCVLVGVTCMATLHHESRALALQTWGMTALYGNGDVSNLTLWPVGFRIGAIWFLLAMFWARLLLHIFAKLPHTVFWVAACFVFGYISSRYVCLPWSVQSGMCAVAFLYLGYLAKTYDVLGRVKRIPYIWVAALLIWIIDVVSFGGMSMAMNDYGSHPVLAVVGSMAGTLCVIGISQLLDHMFLGGLSKLGQASLAILCVHLVEDDVLPWQMYLGFLRAAFPHVPLVLLSFIVRLPIDLVGAALLYRVPVINEWFYPQLVKQRQLRRSKAMSQACVPCGE